MEGRIKYCRYNRVNIQSTASCMYYTNYKQENCPFPRDTIVSFDIDNEISIATNIKEIKSTIVMEKYSSTEKSPYTEAQKNIFDFVETGTGNGIIDAVAGAGKTTTLMGCIDHISNLSDVIYCAFNTSIRKEIQEKFHKANKNVAVSTIHALGFQMLRATGNYKLDDYKYNRIIKDHDFFAALIPDINSILKLHNFPTVEELRELEERQKSLDWYEKNTYNEGQKYIGKIITRLLDINQKYRCTLADDSITCYDLMIRHFGILALWEQDKPTYQDEVAALFRMHQKLLKEGNSIAISHGIIDFTDQLYLPYKLNLNASRKFGFVFVDECQDLSRAQVKVVEKYLREDGRLLAVGDPYQAIYGFAGADCESFERVAKSFNCSNLSLTDCFRCPQDVITLAQAIRGDINGFKDYPGYIYQIPFREVVINIKKGDLVICRTRLPLRNLALKLINKDFKVKIHPDELDEFIGDYRQNFTPQELRKVLNDDIIDAFFEHAKERNKKRIIKENQNADPVIRSILIHDEIVTMEATLDFLKQKYFDWHLNSLEYLLRQLKMMLSCDSKDTIRISTIHRAKGLENDRVFILDYEKLPPKRDLDWENIQERNLHYVAVTRAKEELYLCLSQSLIESDEPDEDAQPAKPINVNNVLPTTVIPSTCESEHIKLEQQVIEKMLASELGYNSLEECENEAFIESLETRVKPRSIGFTVSIRPIQTIKRIPERFYSFAPQEDTPYGLLNGRDAQKAKYWSVYSNLQDTEYSIDNIICFQYMDAYYIKTPNGIEIYNGYYTKGGQYTFKPQGLCENAENVLPLFENESNYQIEFEYNPMTDGFAAIHQLIQAECQELSICNTNIYSESYAIVYCFKTINSYAYIKFQYNGRKTITNIAAFSTLGEEDKLLLKLIESIKHLWQE